MGTYRFPGANKTIKSKPLKKYIRKNKFNKTYANSLTIRQKNINENRAVALIVLVGLFATIYAFAMTSNSIHIINDETVHASSIVEPQSVEEVQIHKDTSSHDEVKYREFTAYNSMKIIVNLQLYSETSLMII